MTAKHQKDVILSGMSTKAARDKINEIFEAAEPGEKLEVKFPGIFIWAETWHRLRSRNETLEVVAQAFAEKVQRLNEEKHKMGERIHTQRLEMVKRLAEIDALKKLTPENLEPLREAIGKVLDLDGKNAEWTDFHEELAMRAADIWPTPAAEAKESK